MLKLSTVGNDTWTNIDNDSFNQAFKEWIPGILTQPDGTCGANAAGVKVGGTVATLFVGPEPDNITSLDIDIGGSGGPRESIPITELVSRLGLQWIPTSGMQAVEATKPRGHRRRLSADATPQAHTHARD